VSWDIRGTQVLDLFAGTGALGIEALSRGADYGVFIEKDAAALSVIRRNIEACGLQERSRIVRWDIRKNLNCLMPPRRKFDFVFMDPPYDRNLIKPALTHLHAGSHLKHACRIVIEHTPKEPIPDDMPMFRHDDSRTYGKTMVSFLTYNP